MAFKHNLPYDQNKSRGGPGALSNAFGNYKNSMQTMPTAKSLGMGNPAANYRKYKGQDIAMSPNTSSAPYVAPKRLNTLKQSTLSSPSPKVPITGFQTQFK
jgi:hypothetical protein